MNYLSRKKVAYIPMVSKIKGFVRTISGQPPIVATSCVDEESLIDYIIYGKSEDSGAVGDKTVNLFDSTQILKASGWKVNDDGVYTGKVSTLWTKFNYGGCFDIEIPDAANQVCITWEGKNETLNGTTFSFVIKYEDGTLSNIPTQYIHSTQWETYKIKSKKGKKIAGILVGYSKSDSIYLRNIQITATEDYMEYEPYGKYKIPIVVSNAKGTEMTEKIYLDKPLESGECLSMKKDGIPILPTYEGTTMYSVETEAQPKEVCVTYFSTEK